MLYREIAGSAEIVIGKAYVLREEVIEIDNSLISPEMVGLELKKFDLAIEKSVGQLGKLKEKVLQELNEDEYMRERAADVKDVGRRLIRNILGTADCSLDEIHCNVIVVGHDLTPSDTAAMDKHLVMGFAVDVGGRTSHTAIMARSLGIPEVPAMGDITRKVKSGDTLILDGIEGIVIVNPNEELIREYEMKRQKYCQYSLDLKCLADLPAVTLDGKKVDIGANIGTPMDIESVVENGGDGVGLYRTEFLYMDMIKTGGNKNDITESNSGKCNGPSCEAGIFVHTDCIKVQVQSDIGQGREKSKCQVHTRRIIPWDFKGY